MARTSAKAKKTKQEVLKSKAEAANAKTEDKEQVEPTKEGDDSKDSVDEENGDSNYEVDKIVDTRMHRGKRQYLVRWKGYDEEGDTWENESELKSCPEALEAFKTSKEESNDDKNGGEEKDAPEQEKDKKGSKVLKIKNAPAKTKKTETDDIKEDTVNDEENNESKDKAVSKKRGKTAAKKGFAKKAKVETATSSKKEEKNTDSKESDDESITDGKDYEVEKILEVHTKKDGNREFLIRWKGYRPSEDTWEPEAHLDCSELIDKFMDKVTKAKSIPTRELRESRAPVERFDPNTKSRGRVNLRRNQGARPSYAESYTE